MTNLKELKIRINSVKSTKKITKVMQMVAGAKLKKAQKKTFDARPCATHSEILINQIISKIPTHELPELIKGKTNTNIHLLFIITSDKGLCGGYNSHITNHLKKYLKEIQKRKIVPKIICIGKKATKILKHNYEKYIIKIVEKIDVDFKAACGLIKNIIENNGFDSVSIFYTKFENSMLQIPIQKQIVPFEKKDIQNYEYKYEKNKDLILEDLIINNLAIQLYTALVESQASEHFARMMAMDNATRNSTDMINKLTLYYNRSRQSSITTELIEIISGVEANQ